VLAGCSRGAVEKAIPFLVKPEEVTPGMSTWYASSCGGCSAGCGILVKCRDGRPIKIEGNPAHPLSKGGLCATGQAMVLSLYDSKRLREPRIGGAPAGWEEVDRLVRARLSDARSAGKSLRIVTGSGAGPATLAAIGALARSFGDLRHVVHEPLSAAALADAHERCYGRRFVPRYRFDRASVIASFDADFLGTWISPVEFTAAYRAGRTPDGPSGAMSYHVQFESRMSLTGSNADRRVPVRPEEIRGLLQELSRHVARETGASAGSLPGGPADQAAGAPKGPAASALPALARRLAEAGPRGLVVCGMNDLACQLTAAWINRMLGNAGVTVETGRAALSRTEDDTAFRTLVDELERGSVGVLVVHGANPVYDHPLGARFAAAMKRAGLAVVFAMHDNETSAHAGAVLPQGHPLEEWGDAEPVSGIVSVRQPVIAPFGNTRPLADSLLAWAGEAAVSPGPIRKAWEASVFPRREGGAADFESFWNTALHDGYAEVAPEAFGPMEFDAAALREAAPEAGGSAAGDFTLELYPTVGLLDGRHAHNPWLQELPDPVTKAAWDNYASVSGETADRLGAEEGDVLKIEAGGIAIELPALIQPGQPAGVVCVALGYGRMGTERFADAGPEWIEAVPTVGPGETVGKNAAPLMTVEGGYLGLHRRAVAVSLAGGRRPVASTQVHHSLHVPERLAGKHDGRRPIVQETSFAAYAASPESGRFETHEPASMWPDAYAFPNHRWAMAVDLTACTGCSACVIGCQAENNIPVVGKDEVSRNREMTWLRIDRYYDEGGPLSVAHQPMMCQHCEHAPCETVCPVLATVHSEEGLNQQVYNRCVGTRYCSNNCPYKVRRFNWFDYPRGGDMERLVLNPDVVVRERGVMEKCSFCVQRIQEGKIRAKAEGRAVKDGEISPACEQSCPAQAIVFGDLNDPASRISALRKNPRFYRVLEDTGVGPSVGYMTLVRNLPDDGGSRG
jgi:molybdopterin-containing oxidoreductase family iron-sulfur binding subunit